MTQPTPDAVKRFRQASRYFAVNLPSVRILQTPRWFTTKWLTTTFKLRISTQRPTTQAGAVRRELINGLDYPVATFEISKSAFAIDPTVTIVMASDMMSWPALSSKRLLAYLSPLTYGDGVSHPQWVFTGDGAGIFVANKSELVSRATTFSRLDNLSVNLPTTVRTDDLSPALATP